MKEIKFSGRQEIWTEPIESLGDLTKKEKRKVCFCPTLQRPTSEKHIKELIPYMSTGWKKDSPGVVFPAESVKENMGKEYTLYDINGLEIPESCWSSYYVVLEGQHRVKALSRGIEAGDLKSVKPEFPSLLAVLETGETIAQWLERYNGSMEKWKASQYISTAHNLSPDDSVLQKYSELVQRGDKTIEDSTRFPLSTLNLIYYGDKGAITESKLKKICRGEEKVPTGYNLKDGTRLVEILRRKFSNPKHYQGRYVTQGFLKIKNVLGSSEKALKVMEALGDSDVAGMIKVGSKSLDPNRVDQVLEKVCHRIVSELI